MLETGDIRLKVSGCNSSLAVLDFNHESSLSKPYRCEVNFIAEDPNLKYDSFIYKRSGLSIAVKGSNSDINGIITQFYQLEQLGEVYVYKIVIEPQIVQLKKQESTDVFLNMPINEIVDNRLKTAGVLHYKFDLTQIYPTREFVCQYQETDYNFIFRWLEYEGIYYYFEHNGSYETLVMTDRINTHKLHKNFSRLTYSPKGSVADNYSNDIVTSFCSHESALANKLVLNGYDYNNNTLMISANALISSIGVGEITLFDSSLLNQEDASRVVNIRAQGLKCMGNIFIGSTLNSSICPGYSFNLEQHFRKNYNQTYLIIETNQKGSQRGFILSKYVQNQNNEDIPMFVNDFKAIPLKVQYRSQLLTPIKKVEGVIPAIIDSETNNNTPYLDEQGRYKIKLLHTNKPDGQSSNWVRKMEGFLGNQYGSHSPLHKNVEVCINFQFSNPDKPVIVGAVHNSSHKNPVTNSKPNIQKWESFGGNCIESSDEKGKEYIKLYSPYGDSVSVIGYSGESDKNKWTNDGWIWPKPKLDDISGWEFNEKSSATRTVGHSYEYTEGDDFSVVHGDSYSAKKGLFDVDLSLAAGKNSVAIVGENTDVTVAGASLSSSAIAGIAFETSYATKKVVIDEVPMGVTEYLTSDDVDHTIDGNHEETVTGNYVETVNGFYNTRSYQNMVFTAPIISLKYGAKEDAPAATGATVTISDKNINLTSGIVGSSISLIGSTIKLSSGMLSSIIIDKNQICLSCGTSSIKITKTGITTTGIETVPVDAEVTALNARIENLENLIAEKTGATVEYSITSAELKRAAEVADDAAQEMEDKTADAKVSTLEKL